MCWRYERRRRSHDCSHTLMLGSMRGRCWRCKELFILGSVVNWSNGLWTSTKPLPNSGADPCNVERWHGEGKRKQQGFHTRRQPLQSLVADEGLEKWEKQRSLARSVEVELRSGPYIGPRVHLHVRGICTWERPCN